MSLREAIAYARAHHPAVRAALARIAQRTVEAQIPRSRWYPTLGVTAQMFVATANNTTGTYVNPGVLDLPRIGGTLVNATGTWQPYPATLAAVGISQEIFDFGRIAAQAAASDALVTVEREAALVRELEITYGVEEAYFAVFAAKAIVTASDQAYQRSLVHRDLARAGVKSGLRSPIELTRAEADLTKFEVGRVNARGGLDVSQTVLAAAVGVADSKLDVTGNAPSPLDLPSIDEALRLAEARDPRWLATVAALRAQEAETTSLSARLRPDLALTATLSSRAGGAAPSGSGTLSPGQGWIPGVPNWDLGVVLSWPLFDRTLSSQANASRARESVRREEVALAHEQDVAAVRQAYARVQIARAALPALDRAVEAARANDAQAEARFQGGMGTSVELADAEALRTAAEIQLALGHFELARARAALGRTIAEGI